MEGLSAQQPEERKLSENARKHLDIARRIVEGTATQEDIDFIKKEKERIDEVEEPSEPTAPPEKHIHPAVLRDAEKHRRKHSKITGEELK